MSCAKCIVLDLDQTLLYSADGEEIKQFQKLKLNDLAQYRNLLNRCYFFTIEDTPGDGVRFPIWGIKRPHLDEFLSFCFGYFELVIIWSAGRKDYVHNIVKKLFINTPQPHIVLSSEDVDYVNKNPVKSLPKLISIINTRYPQYSGKLSLENTVAVDDIETNFSKNPNNGILIPEYAPAITYKGLAEDDDSLRRIMNFFLKEEMFYEKDVRLIPKHDIFAN